MNNKVTWLRCSYWVGALVDFLAAVLLTFPGLMSFFYGLGPIEPTAAFRSVDASAAVLMWGWTGLLVWAQRKPLERRGVLYLTLLPVLAGLIFYRGLDIWVYHAALETQLPYLALQLILAALFSASLWINRKN